MDKMVKGYMNRLFLLHTKRKWTQNGNRRQVFQLYTLDGGNFGTVSSNFMGNKYGASFSIQSGITNSANRNIRRKKP